MGGTPEDDSTQEEEKNSVHQKRTKRGLCGRRPSKWSVEELSRLRLLWFALQKFWDRPKLVSPFLLRGEGATVPFEIGIKTSDRRAPRAQSVQKSTLKKKKKCRPGGFGVKRSKGATRPG